MKKIIRGIAATLTLVMMGASMPTFGVSADSLPSPFDTSVINNSGGAVSSVVVNSSESIGYNSEVSFYKATIKSTGTRKELSRTAAGKKNRRYAETFGNVGVAIGGKLFVYSVPATDNLAFEDYTIDVIAKKFEETHPGWKVAIASNASFFDRKTSIGEPEDIYVEEGKTYKTYIEKGEGSGDVFKVGRGIVGLKDDGSVIYHTIEKGTSHYTGSTPYEFDSQYTLQLLGENKNNPIYEYTLAPGGSFDFAYEPIFITPTMAAKDLRGATVYTVKCSQFRRAHTAVNSREVGDKTFYFEGEITSVAAGTNSMRPASGYVYIASQIPLEHIQVGDTVRGTQKLSGEWSDVITAFGYKQQILHNGTVLFEGAYQEDYGDPIEGDWDNTWSEDLDYATYGTNRTALGFKADGTPVIIAMPRKVYSSTAGHEASATYSEMAWYMKSLGCVNAFMMDCGGSTGMYKKGTGSDTYEVAVCPAGKEYPDREVANALILAYPSGEEDNPTDEKLDAPAFASGVITKDMNTPWYSGLTKLRSTATVSNYSSDTFDSNGTLKKTNFTLVQDGSTYTFTPTSTKFTSGYEAIYAYKKLGYTVDANKKYTYCFKLHTVTEGKYTSFLFGEYPSNADKNKMLNNFAVIGGAFSNNGDSTYSDVRVGRGRVELSQTAEIDGKNQDINLYLETEFTNGKKYSYYRIDIDGLNYTVKVKNIDGVWEQIGGTYTLPTGTKLVMGCASWEANTKRAMSVCDPVCVDVTSISKEIEDAKALDSLLYTADSFANVTSALADAETAIQLTNQNFINYTGTNLATATDNLVERMAVANANIAAYESTDSMLYTAESWVAYKSAYDNIVTAKNNNDLASLDALNAAFTSAKSSLVPASISLDVSWQQMDFTYYPAAEQIWDPETHSYVNAGDPTWVANENSNVISVENNSNVDLVLDFDYTAKEGFEAISGEFYSNGTLIESDGLALACGSAADVSLTVKGELPLDTEDNTSGATVTLTVSRG